MTVFSGEEMYIIPQGLIEAWGLEFDQLLFDAGRIDGDEFIRRLKAAEARRRGSDE